MDLTELRHLIRRSLNVKLKEYAAKRRKPIDNFSDFMFEFSRAAENSGLTCANDYFDLVHEAWANIKTELLSAEKGEEVKTWNDSVDHYVTNVVLEISNLEGFSWSESEKIAQNSSSLLRRK